MPFGLGRNREQAPNIAVTLIDVASGEELGRTELPADDLPETFEVDTTMHLGSEDWRVEKADPVDRTGYVASSQLTLWLRRLETLGTTDIDPSQLRFTMPTLEDALPPMRRPDSSQTYAMHEDDWRQREFVSRQFADDIESELREIREIWAEQDGVGFERVHIRTRVPAPLRGIELTLDEVAAALGGIEPLSLTVGDGQVVDGFAFPLSGGAAYGRVAGGLVETLALHGGAEPGGLGRRASVHSLVLVDWIRTSTT